MLFRSELYKQFNTRIQTDLNSNWTINSDIKNATEHVMYWNINDIHTKIKGLTNPPSMIDVVEFSFYNNNNINKDAKKVLQQSLKAEIKKLNAFISVATTNIDDMDQTKLNSFDTERQTAYTGVVNLTYFGDSTQTSQKSTIDSINTTILANIDTRQNTLDKTRLKSKYEDRKSTRLNSSHSQQSRMPSSA